MVSDSDTMEQTATVNNGHAQRGSSKLFMLAGLLVATLLFTLASTQIQLVENLTLLASNTTNFATDRAVAAIQMMTSSFKNSTSRAAFWSLANHLNYSILNAPTPLLATAQDTPLSNETTLFPPTRPGKEKWFDEAMLTSRTAYARYLKVVECKEPQTLKGSLERINNTAWLFLSRSTDGERKKCGGDQLVALIRTVDRWEHMASVTDMEDGTYILWFDRTCGEAAQGNLTVAVQYTKGDGWLSSSVKKYNLLNRLVIFLPNVVINSNETDSERPVEWNPPRSTSLPHINNELEGRLSIAMYAEKIIAVGDSLMENVINSARKSAGIKISLFRTGSPLNSKNLQSKFMTHFLKDDVVKAYKEAKFKKKVVFLINSGVWDVIMMNEQNQEPYPRRDMFRDHLETLDKWLDAVLELFPEATVLWKETTDLHPHEADCTQVRRAKLRSACLDRLMGLNSFQSKLLRQLQELVIKAKGVPILEDFDLSFRHPEFTIPGDGRHYTPILNQIMWESWSINNKGEWETLRYKCPRDFYRHVDQVALKLNDPGTWKVDKGLEKMFENVNVSDIIVKA